MCGLSIQRSAAIRKLYPYILLLEISTVSALLALESLLDYSLYVALGVLSTITVLLLVAAPYNHTVDNARLFAYRFLLLAVCCLQIVFKSLNRD